MTNTKIGRDKLLKTLESILFTPDQKITCLVLHLPIRIISEANNHDHWTKRQKRKVAQRDEVLVEIGSATHNREFQLPCTVTLTRIANRELDTDNLANGFKAVRDAVARKLGVDDADQRVTWQYAQEKVAKREYSIRIEIESL